MTVAARSIAAAALLSVGAALAVTASPREAAAYACYEPTIKPWPLGEAASVDTLVRLRFPGPAARVLRLGPNRQILEETTVEPLTTVFVIVGPDGASVPMRRRILDGTDLPWLELAPDRALSPHAAYHVVVREHGRDFQVGDFTTGEAAPADAPAVEGGGDRDAAGLATPAITRARFVHLAHVEYKGTAGPYVRVRFREPAGADASGPAAAPRLFEVHALAEDAEIGPGTLRAIVPGDARGLVFGKTSLCEPQDVAFPSHGKQRFALRPIDAAGRTGKPVAFTVDVDHPSTVDAER